MGLSFSSGILWSVHRIGQSGGTSCHRNTGLKKQTAEDGDIQRDIALVQ